MLDTVVYLLLALFAFVLICIPTLLGYRSSSPASVAARGASVAGFLLLVGGAVLAASCLLGDCLGLVASGSGAFLPYLWFFAPGIFFSLAGWALALAATDRRSESRRFMLILFAPPATLLAVVIAGLLLGANGAGVWIAATAYLTPCLPLFILLAVPKGRGSVTVTAPTHSAPHG